MIHQGAATINNFVFYRITSVTCFHTISLSTPCYQLERITTSADNLKTYSSHSSYYTISTHAVCERQEWTATTYTDRAIISPRHEQN